MKQSNFNRIKKLRERVISTTPKVCIERARLITEAYGENESLPVVLKRAKALERILSKMSIYIDEDELIVGNQASKPRSAPIFPEYSVDWIEKEIDEFAERSGDKFLVDEGIKPELLEIVNYWKGKTVKDRANSTIPEDVKKASLIKAIDAEGNLTSGDGHIVVDFEKVLKKGLNGIIKEIENEITNLNLAEPQDLKKRTFLEAARISLNAAIIFARRYSEEARRLAKVESNFQRKEELEKISQICRCVPANPARNFWEAIQSVWFAHLITQIESNGHSFSLGRLDQYLYPYYVKDMAEGPMGQDQILELVESLWIKLYTINKIRPWSHTQFGAGYPTYQNVTIGGQTPDGDDATNDLSFLCLKTVQHTRLTQPNLSARFHNRCPEEFLMKCAETIRMGFGMPAMHNDEIIIPSLLLRGVEVKDAYNYSMVGCIEVAVPGKWGYRCTGMSFLNMGKVLELALNNGKDPKTGIQLCSGNGDLGTFSSLKELMKAWEKQVKFYTKLHVILDSCIDYALEELTPDAFCSALVEDCIKRGKAIKEGGAKYDFISGLQAGLANIANSLAAIKKLIFEEHLITRTQLKEALRCNFEGIEGEKIRQILINKAPKYGNDEDYVDLLGRKAYNCYIREIAKYKNTRYGRGPIGGTYYPSTSVISANVPLGGAVGTTPDGRKSGQPLAEGASPAQSTDRLGPTAVIKSVSKLPTILITGGQLLNLKFLPEILEGLDGLRSLAFLIRTFFQDLKGWHVQFNVVSAKVLKEAQRRPEKYPNLIVRVAGYCAVFTTLAPEIQNDIISRTEHTRI